MSSSGHRTTVYLSYELYDRCLRSLPADGPSWSEICSRALARACARAEADQVVEHGAEAEGSAAASSV